MIDLSTLTVTAWVVLVVGALVIGFSKTAIGGLVMVAVALFAAVLPAKPSTGVALLLLIVGDLFAIRAYTKYADWTILRRLAPFVAVGVVVGAVFLKLAGDVAVKRTIGAILIVLVLVSIVRKLRTTTSTEEKPPPSTLLEASAGAGSGFMSMVANAGSLIYLYLLRLGLPMMTFLGTAAWYFFVVNLVKVPISVGLGLITTTTLVLTLVLSPAVAVGAVLGRYVVTRLSMPVFEWAVLVVTLLASVNLVR